MCRTESKKKKKKEKPTEKLKKKGLDYRKMYYF